MEADELKEHTDGGCFTQLSTSHSCPTKTYSSMPVFVQRRKDADELKARAQMEAALASSAAGGASWGMSLDDEEEDEGGPAKEVNWRSYVDKHSSNLTDRQTKLLDKIR